MNGCFAVALPGIGQALFTTRAQGNLSLRAGIGHEHGLQARERLCGALGLQWLCAGPQLHGARVRRICSLQATGGTPVLEGADGQATGVIGIGAMVLAADCVPIVIAAPHAVAAIHAGWRGLVAGVIEEGVTAVLELSEDGASRELIAVVGPCAGACCYLVGEDVHAAFAQSRGEARPGQARPLDLREHAHRRLLAAGVQRIDDVNVCTICDERMFSHRREGEQAGRQAAIAWLS